VATRMPKAPLFTNFLDWACIWTGKASPNIGKVAVHIVGVAMKALAGLVFAALVSACATQSFATLAPVQPTEMQSCARIEAETRRAQGFRDQVGAEAHWYAVSARRGEARRSVKARLRQLEEARAALACPVA